MTEKIAPYVFGDGRCSVQQLVQRNPDFKFNKEALLAHARHLDYIPSKGAWHQVIIQGSHTYGSIFKDRNDQISQPLESWLNKLCAVDGDFYFGRFDMKVKDREALHTGKGVKIIELNGC